MWGVEGIAHAAVQPVWQQRPRPLLQHLTHSPASPTFPDRVYFKEGSHTKLEDEYVVVGHDKDLKDYKAFGEREEKKRQAEYDAEEKKRQARFAMEEKKRQAEEKAAEKKRNAHLQTQLRELAAVGVLPGAQLQVCWKLPNDDVKVRMAPCSRAVCFRVLRSFFRPASLLVC